MENKLNYEASYHKERYAAHMNPDYYLAKALVAVRKFFKGVDFKSRTLTVLDYGCGTGQNIYAVNAVVTGFDISEYATDFARNKGIPATTNTDQLGNEAFDIVLSSHVLEHHPHPKDMLVDIKRKLKVGGELRLIVPVEKQGKSNFNLDLNQHLYCWNFRTLNNLLITSGFMIDENKYVRGIGYDKLLFLYKINFNLYYLATNLLSRLLGIKEIMVVATKIN